MPSLYTSSEPVDVQRFLTPLEDAVAEIHKRRTDPHLLSEVESYLEGSIPEHFKKGPILYLARHIATPNFETLRFIELCKRHPTMPAVIGQDFNDKFVSNNSLKQNMGKMPIVKGIARNTDEIIEYFTIIDFAKAQGHKLKEVQTFFGQSLPEFHNELFKSIYPHEVSLVEESEWIDLHGRGDLLEHYKKLLALFVVHGIMFEFYPEHDKNEISFVEKVLAPSFEFVEKTFGVKPLLTPLVPTHMELNKSWEAYPSIFYKGIKDSLENIRTD